MRKVIAAFSLLTTSLASAAPYHCVVAIDSGSAPEVVASFEADPTQPVSGTRFAPNEVALCQGSEAIDQNSGEIDLLCGFVHTSASEQTKMSDLSLTNVASDQLTRAAGLVPDGTAYLYLMSEFDEKRHVLACDLK